MKKLLTILMSCTLFTLLSASSVMAVKLSMIRTGEAGSPKEKKFLLLLEKFKASNPEIELEVETIPHDAYFNKLQAMKVADELPDLMDLWPGKRTAFITEAGFVKDLRPWLAGKEDQFAPIAMAPQGSNGEIFELPYTVTATHVMYTNNKLLSDLGLSSPKTLQELLDQAPIIRKAGLIPLVAGAKSEWVMQSCLLSTLADRSGGTDWFTKAIKGEGASFADSEFVDALKVLQSLKENKVFVPGISMYSRDAAQADFVNNRAVYFLEGDWKTGDLIDGLSAEQKKHLSFETFPTIPGQKGASDSTSAVPGGGYGMNTKLAGEIAEAAWKWIWFYAGPEGAQIHLEVGGEIPSYKLSAPSTDLDPLTIKRQQFIASAPMTYVLDNKMDAEGMGILNPAIQELLLGVKTAEEVATEYEKWVSKNDSNRL